ncbi:MAG: succinate dehydrogenase cytochrome b subunit [Bacteroides sp.]|nr:succinate dehydrogenase cytochrome b subunit [Bacteroides sp.]MDD2645220.1 succinate dehydrogenase cytochrome b subunit [Bacteroides sp.]MDD4719783.1 succinate dehydrogenase cytochrome b subunit [Bacteroides sp.]NLI63460.1 succinate dehydrogenase cytochrome b subunit [Bacteroidales bacterium]
MWLINSSVGRKVVMSITGLALILFLTFHMAMNVVAIFSGDAYNLICEFLGANWYALVGTLGLAALFIIHIFYAAWLTLQNQKARGKEKYAVYNRNSKVEWSSQNMFILGFVVILGLVLHLFNFWYNMQFQEIIGNPSVILGGTEYVVHDGAGFIQYTFSQPLYVVLYLIWLVALWLHLNHGFWSALQSIGWSNDVWFKRWKVVSTVYTTVLILGFAAVVVFYYGNTLM